MVSIRVAQPVDAHQLIRWWANGNVMAHAGFPNGLVTDYLKLKARLKNSDLSKSAVMIIMVNNHAVGEMAYRILEENQAEIGIKICDFTLHHKGIGTQAITQLLILLFEERNIEKVILDTNLNNKKAQAFYEKLGFRRLRINKDVFTDQLGQKQSSIDYEMTKETYKNKVKGT